MPGSSSPEHQHKEKDPRTVHQSIISSTKFSLRAGNIWGLEALVPLNLANPAAGGSQLPQCETGHLASCNAGLAWGHPGCDSWGCFLPRCGTGPTTVQRHLRLWQGRYCFFSHGSERFISIPGESMPFQSQKWEQSESTGPHLRTLKCLSKKRILKW